MTKQPAVSCHKCVYFYVTWDKSFPYGCRSMGFKGRTMPSVTVQQSSGQACLAFEAKDGPAAKQPR